MERQSREQTQVLLSSLSLPATGLVHGPYASWQQTSRKGAEEATEPTQGDGADQSNFI